MRIIMHTNHNNCNIYNFAFGHWSSKSLISHLGQSGFRLGAGRSRSHAHFSFSSGARSSSSI
jgi:hypothetical protein